MKRALVVEGGAMRGVFAAGVLDKFMEHDYHSFDFAIGVSAGATNLSTYVSKMHGLSKTIITQYATKREFFSPLRFIKGGHMTDVHWLWHHSKQSLGITGPNSSAAMPLYVGITNTQTGQCEYHQATEDNVDALMVASCALPTAFREQPIINGTRYVDGGVAVSPAHADKNNNDNVRPQTDTIRLVSSKLVLRGASRRPGRPF